MVIGLLLLLLRKLLLLLLRKLVLHAHYFFRYNLYLCKAPSSSPFISPLAG